MNLKKQLANYLRAGLDRTRLTQDEFAEQLGIAKSSLMLYLYETGNPRLDTIEVLADKLDLKLVLIPRSKTKMHLEMQKISDDVTVSLTEFLDRIYKFNPE